jgi:transposase
VCGHQGGRCPPAEPGLLLALWLHATLQGVGAANALKRLCRGHLAYQWPCGGVGMNHRTLAHFRVSRGELL